MSSVLKLFRFQKNNALEERPEGVTSEANSWEWVSVKQKYEKQLELSTAKQKHQRGPKQRYWKASGFPKTDKQNNNTSGRSISRGALFHAAFSIHSDSLNVLFLNLLGKPKVFHYLCFDSSYFWLFRKPKFLFHTIGLPTLMHGVVKERTSHVASRSANMSIASHQEDKVEWVS